MGMFDQITSDRPLPVPGFDGLDFQTKDLECCLSRYRITWGGRLKRLHYRLKKVRRKKGDDLAFLGPWRMKRTHVRWRDCAYTGGINFYTTLGEDHSGWVEFSAYFLEGRLREIHLVKYRRSGTRRERVALDALPLAKKSPKPAAQRRRRKASL